MSLKPVITKLVLLTGLVLALLVAATAATASTTLDRSTKPSLASRAPVRR